MQQGVLEGDGRTKLRWLPDDKIIKWVDRLSSNFGVVADAEYNKLKFTLKGEYCPACDKFIADFHPSKEQ